MNFDLSLSVTLCFSSVLCTLYNFDPSWFDVKKVVQQGCLDLVQRKWSLKMKRAENEEGIFVSLFSLWVSETTCLSLGIERMEPEVRRQSYYFECYKTCSFG